jgi:hypothetical protein
MAVAAGDPEALARLLRMVDSSLLPTIRAGRTALTESGLASEQHVRTALRGLTEVESDLACLLASHGMLI